MAPASPTCPSWVTPLGTPSPGLGHPAALPWRGAFCTHGRPGQETTSVGKLKNSWVRGVSSWPLLARSCLQFWGRLQKHILQNCNIFIYLFKDCVSCTLNILIMHIKDLVVSLFLYFPCRTWLYHKFCVWKNLLSSTTSLEVASNSTKNQGGKNQIKQILHLAFSIFS